MPKPGVLLDYLCVGGCGGGGGGGGEYVGVHMLWMSTGGLSGGLVWV